MADRTVTQMLVLFPTDEGGNAVRFSFLCFCGLVLVLCRFLAKFSSSKGRFLRKNFRERTFVFAFFLGPCVFDRDLPMGFRVFSRNFVPEVP